MDKTLTASVRKLEIYHRERKVERDTIWNMLDEGVFGKIYDEDDWNHQYQELISKWEKNFWLKHDDYLHDVAQLHKSSSNKIKHELKCPVEKIKNYFFVTINPKPDVTIDKFIPPVEKFFISKTILAYEARYEQKGIDDDTLGNGFHVHIIVRGNSTLRKAHIISKIQNYFKSMVGMGQPDVEILYDADSLGRVREYIRDAKDSDESKRPAYLMDDKWRKSVNISPLYFKGNIDPSEEP